MDDQSTRLPSQPATRFTRPFMRFLRIEAVAGVTLLFSTVVALVLSNSGWSAQYLGFWEMPVGLRFDGFEFSRSLKHWINDALMSVFFFVIALELKREVVLGEMRQLRVAALPAAAALGGMVVPAAVFLLLVGDGPGAKSAACRSTSRSAAVSGSRSMRLGSTRRWPVWSSA